MSTRCKDSGFARKVWGGYQVRLFHFQLTDTQPELAQTKGEWMAVVMSD